MGTTSVGSGVVDPPVGVAVADALPLGRTEMISPSTHWDARSGVTNDVLAKPTNKLSLLFSVECKRVCLIQGRGVHLPSITASWTGTQPRGTTSGVLKVA